MTQEDKKLLYKDLVARQPYRPFICFAGKLTMPFLDVIASTENNELMSINGLNPDYVKPYLRPMSSMTEDEKKEFDDFCVIDEFAWNGNAEIGYKNQAIIISDAIDWLNAHHFNYRGLIEKGLALEAPSNMYKTE